MSSTFPALRQVIFVLLFSLCSLVNAADLTSAMDLRSESEIANRLGKPLIILFSRSRCPYCDVVRRDYLLPLEQSSQNQGKVVIRQINIDRNSSLIDFSGNSTTHSAFAAQQKIKLVPVVAFYGPQGQSLAAPIIGVRIADFYQSYLDEAIQASINRLGNSLNPS